MLDALSRFEAGDENDEWNGNATKFLAYYQVYLPSGVTLPHSTFCNHVKERKKGRDKTCLPRTGGPLTLGERGEDLLLERLRQVEKEVSHLTSAIIIREALDFARIHQPGESTEDVISRLRRCGGDDWLSGFKKRHKLKIKARRRAVEIERAIKNQPEETVLWLRLLLHSFAVLQIHRAMAAGVTVEGWTWNTDKTKVTRENNQGSEPKNDLVECKSVEGVDVFWHKVLNKALEPPKVIFGLDEKPILPDSPLKEMLNNLRISYGRTSSWSIAVPLLISGKVKG